MHGGEAVAEDANGHLKSKKKRAIGRYGVLPQIPSAASSIVGVTMFLVPVNRNTADLSRSLERFLDDGLAGLFGAPGSPSQALRSPALDVSETEHSYTVKLDMPGVPKDTVKIHIDGRRVSIDAEQRKDEEKQDGERVLYRERALSRYSRSFALPEEISQSDSVAKMDHGVLTLSLVKRQAKGSTQLSVS
jgi:HSP20 family protein